jgi:predicted permease
VQKDPKAPAKDVEHIRITVPIYVLIGIGFLAGRFGLFSAAEMRAMGNWVANFAVPALLSTALSQRSIGEILHGSYLLVYAGGSLIALLIADLVVRLGRKKDIPFAAMTGLSMSFSKSALIGYPIALQVVGQTAAVALAMCVAVENILMLPLALTVAECSGRDERKWHAVIALSVKRLARRWCTASPDRCDE